MIRYAKATLEQLHTDVDGINKTWRERAAKRLAELRAAGAYSAGGPAWSDIKIVYLRLQGDSKCVFCERKLESEDLGLIEQDVEHFRPKSNVSAWPVPDELKALNIAITEPAANGGYYLLPHHVVNYAASCKPCNSVCKSDFFPIAGSYAFDADDPLQLDKELPLLIYPLGVMDADPEDLIGFHGITPIARKKSGHARNRALVTIALFRLNDVTGQRSNLYLERAQAIIAVYPFLRDSVNRRLPAKERARARTQIEVAMSPKMSHANCVRSFERLFKEDRKAADALYDDALAYRRSKS